MSEPQTSMDDITESIAEIYDAVGDAERWQRLNERLAAMPRLSPEIEPHIETARRAHEESRRLTDDIETFANVHDNLALGALVVDRLGLLQHANTTAARLLSNGNGLMLDRNRLRASNPRDDVSLQGALERAATSAGREDDSGVVFARIARQDQEPLLIVALPPLAPTLRFFEDRLPVTLLVIDPDLTVMPAIDTLRALYGFTVREAEIALLLIQGLSVSDAAVTMGVSVTTARTFLAQITAKTDSHSQAELMMRLLAIPRTQGST
jgi:DNA-binding CsgD family transcriptional regulator